MRSVQRLRNSRFFARRCLNAWEPAWNIASFATRSFVERPKRYPFTCRSILRRRFVFIVPRFTRAIQSALVRQESALRPVVHRGMKADLTAAAQMPGAGFFSVEMVMSGRPRNHLAFARNAQAFE